MDELIEIDEQAWDRGGTPGDSRFIPWAVQSIDSDDIDYWQGRLTEQFVTEAVETFIEYLQS